MSVEATAPSWAKSWGVFLVVYACLGLCLGIGGGVTAALSAELAKMGGMKDLPPLPPSLMALTWTMVVASVVLAIMLIQGALALMKARRSSAKLLVRWATVRIVIAGVGLIATQALATTQSRYNEAVHEAVRAMTLDRTKEDVGPYAESGGASIQKWAAPGVTLLVCIVPVIVAVTLSKRRAEIEGWPD